MRIVLTACSSLAITFATVAFSPSQVVADDAIVAQEISPLRSQLEQIRADVAKAELPCHELVAQIDALIAKIDALLDAGSADQVELIKVRNAALKARVRVQCDAEHFQDGVCTHCGRSVNGTTLTNDAPADQPLVGGAVNGEMGSPMMGDPMMGPMMGDPMMGQSMGGMGSSMGNGYTTTSGGGAGGGGGGRGGMGFVALGGIAAAIAIPLSVEDDQTPGPIASPSAP